MKILLLALLLFSSPVIAGTNNLDKTFLDITMNCRKFRIFDSPDQSVDVETNCIKTKLNENNLSKAKYNKWTKAYWTKRKDAWNKFLKDLERK